MSSQYEYDPTRISGSGEVAEGTAGAAIANRAACYLGADGLYYQADADAAATMPAVALAMSAMTVGQKGEFLVKGFIGLSTWVWTTGSELYISGTAGQMSHVAGATIQQVGIAYSATQIFFNPSGYGTGAGGCALLEGDTAYVGFDSCKSPYTNYFYCDSVADEVQINQAITYVNGLGGGSVHLERGTYDITATIDIQDDNIHLRGSGWDTVLRLANGTNTTVIYALGTALNTVDNVIISHLRVDGNRANNTGPALWWGIRGDYVRDYIVEDCKVDSTLRSGIRVTQSERFQLLNNNVYDCRIGIIADANSYNGTISNNLLRESYGTSGISVYTPNSRINIDGNIVLSATTAGIELNGPSNITVSNNVTYDSGSIGIHLDDVATVGASNCVVQGNTSISEGQNGILVNEYCTRNIVADNNIYQSTTQGIYIIEDENVVSGNLIDASQTQESLRVDGDGNTVMDNYIIDNAADHGIYITGNNNVVKDNLCEGNVGDGMRVTGNYNKLMENVLTNNTGAGIDLRAGATDNIVRNNNFDGNGSVISDAGTGTQVHEIFVNTIDPLTTLGDHPVVTLTDGATTNVYNSINLPLGFQEIVTAQLIVTPGGTGNMRWQLDTDFGKICANENYNAHSDSVAANETAVDINQMECLDISTGLTGVAGGDLIGFNFARIGGHANDTVNADCYYMGIRLRYV